MLGVGRHGPLGPARLVPAEGAAPASVGGGRTATVGRLDEAHALAVLVGADGLGPVTLARLVTTFGSAVAVLDAASRGETAALAAAARSEERAAPLALAPSLVAVAARAGEILTSIERSGVALMTLDDLDYPPRLRGIELPPHLLFVRGDRAALSSERAVAVVGTRRPSDGGRLTAARIAGAIARCGSAVVSGLAVGIDGAAHAACLAEGGVTVAVLGGGHDHLFPRSHDRLVGAIVAGGGAVVSELPPTMSPNRGTFPRRNRIISGLAEATVVVEAGARSGALITAQWALEQGRGCFVVPGPIDRPTSAGCLSLLREAAGEARVVAGVPQLLEDLDLAAATDGPALPRSAGAAVAELDPLPRRIAGHLIDGLTSVDEIVSATREPVAAVLASLTMLEDRGLVVDAYGRYRPSGLLASRPAGPRSSR